MNITFLIGNGFDVGIGLKSKYTDFYKVFCKDSSLNEDGKELAKEIDHNHDDWSYFEKQLGVYSQKFNPESSGKMISQIREFVRQFMIYLEEEERKVDYSASKYIATIMKNGLKDFYGRNILQTVSSDQIANLFNSNGREIHHYNFICFNYTNVLEKCLGTIEDKIVNTRTIENKTYNDIIGSIAYPHGRRNAFPIMGVNDASQIKNLELSHLYRFSKYLIKPEINKAQRMNYDKNAEQVLFNSDIICVYGMSLGETDKIWWSSILQWLSRNSSKQLVIFLYDKNYRASTPYDLLLKEDEVIDNLARMVNNQSYVESMRNQIHIAIHKNIFEMNLRKESKISSDEETNEENIEIDPESINSFLASFV